MVQCLTSDVQRRRSVQLPLQHSFQSQVTSHGLRIIVGFALEDKDLRENAEKKLKEKNLNMIVANEPEAVGGEKSADGAPPSMR